MKISIGGKVSDMSWLHVDSLDGKPIIRHDGYVPCDIGIGGGDYIELEIDNDTGKVVGWVPLTIEQLKESISGEEEEY